MKKPNFKKSAMSLTIVGFLFMAQTSMTFASTVTKATATPKPAATPKPKTTQNSNNINPQGFQGRNRQQFDIKPVLDKLVKAKTITAAQETKIIAYQNKKNAERTAQMEKLRKMSDAERQAYMAKQFNQNNGQNQNRNQFQYADLVKNKTITQKQADAISKAIAAARPNFRNRPNGGFNNQNNPNN